MKYIKVPATTPLEEIQKLQEHYDQTLGKGKFLVIKDTFSVESEAKHKGDLLLG